MKPKKGDEITVEFNNDDITKGKFIDMTFVSNPTATFGEHFLVLDIDSRISWVNLRNVAQFHFSKPDKTNE